MSLSFTVSELIKSSGIKDGEIRWMVNDNPLRVYSTESEAGFYANEWGGLGKEHKIEQVSWNAETETFDKVSFATISDIVTDPETGEQISRAEYNRRYIYNPIFQNIGTRIGNIFDDFLDRFDGDDQLEPDPQNVPNLEGENPNSLLPISPLALVSIGIIGWKLLKGK